MNGLLWHLLFSIFCHQKMATTSSHSSVRIVLGWLFLDSSSFCTTTCSVSACLSPSCVWSIRQQCTCSVTSSQMDQTCHMWFKSVIWVFLRIIVTAECSQHVWPVEVKPQNWFRFVPFVHIFIVGLYKDFVAMCSTFCVAFDDLGLNLSGHVGW